MFKKFSLMIKLFLTAGLGGLLLLAFVPLSLATSLSSNAIPVDGPADNKPAANTPVLRPASQVTETGFVVTIENVSGASRLPSPLSPGAWAVHGPGVTDSLFTVGAPAGAGLEDVAEDGTPGVLAAELAARSDLIESGTFGTGPILPGGAYSFTFSTSMTDARLSLATMFVQSNDVFAAPDEMGIALFNPDGTPISDVLDVTGQISFWDAGTEVNEAPGMGPNQAPRQSGPDTGASEGGVFRFDNTTRSLPLAGRIAEATVMESGGTFTVSLTNVSGQNALASVIAPVFYATHAVTWTELFTEGAPDSGQGLELLAEDGSPAQLITSYTGAPGIGQVGAQDTPLGGTPGPAAPGQTYQFTVTPDAAHPRLTLASMVVETNDAFLAFDPAGVALLDDSGTPRPVADIEAEMGRMLAVWDAGTEANEVPGVGPNQAPRQPAGNTGPADPNDAVRRYADPANDLADGFADVSIELDSGLSFTVLVTNTSGSTAYPGALTPVAWAVHSNTVALFTEGVTASAELETLAEDGDSAPLVGVLGALPGVADTNVVGAGPITAGGSISFTVTMDAAHPYLSLASMVVPSNDTFMAFDPSGVRLLDQSGQPRSNADIAADVAAQLAAWDAGTERNQAGAAGPDQAPRQAGPDTGADEGSGLVRLLNDPVWAYPVLSNTLRVTIGPFDQEATIYLPIILKN